MHAAVEAGKVGEVAKGAEFAVGERVEQADFDVFFRIERSEGVVHAARIVVVEQQAHAHAATGGLLQHLEQHFAGHVVVPDIVGDVERMVGVADKDGAGDKGVVRVGQQVHARLPCLFFRRPLRGQGGFQARGGFGVDIGGNAAL